MLVIKLELWPGGREDKKKTLGVATIINDGTGSRTKGNYRYNIQGGGGRQLRYGVGRITDFPRRQKHAWYLLKLVLSAFVANREGPKP